MQEKMRARSFSGLFGLGRSCDVFDENKVGQWEEARNFLREHLSDEEYEKAKIAF